MSKHSIHIILLTTLTVLVSCSAGTLRPTDLRCEWMTGPRVVDVATPRLGWVNEPGRGAKDERQTAYQILVASSEALLEEGKADFWDSGKVVSEESVLVPYGGKTLPSGADCYWKVRVWNAKDKPSRWSETGYWGMGILDPAEWKAEWIGAPWQGEEPYKKFEPEKPLPVPEGMSMADFMKIVQQFMDNPGAGFPGLGGGAPQGERPRGNRPQGARPDGPRPQRQQAQQPTEAQVWSASTKEYKTDQTPAPLLRKAFNVSGKVVSAKAFVVGLGYYEFYVNGAKLGDEVLVPNQTNYSVRPIAGQYGPTTDDLFRAYRVLYTAYDITDLLQQGKNVAGAIVGEGFYNAVGQYQVPFGSSRFLCQIEITMEDGSRQTVCTDGSWKARKSPILVNGVFEGEVYDANAEVKDWCSPACDDAAWENVALRVAPTGQLTAQTAPGDVVYDILKPVSVQKNDDGSYDVDFGKEITGWVRFKDFRGEKGDTLSVKFENDQILMYDKYIFDGNPVKEYAPRFTFYTFSKVTVSGIDNLKPDMMQAEWVCTNLPKAAEFTSSNTLFGQILDIWQRSQLDNTHGGLASDCPHRERSGYTGDGQVSAAVVMDYFDAAAFYRKWVRDMNDCQNVATGHVPNVAPTNNGAGGIPWGAAIGIIPWEHYLHYGDVRILEDNYFAMKEYVRFMENLTGPDGVIDATKDPDIAANCGIMGSLGDWCSPFGNPDRVVLHQFYFWYCADVLAKSAQLLGNAEDAARYAELRDKLYDAIHARFYQAEGQTYGPKGANVFALRMGVPADRKAGVVESLRKELEEHDGHLFTGIFGSRYLFEVLAENGLNDAAWEALSKTDFPSFGAWIEAGATTTRENWDSSGSHNHPMFGGGLVWLNNSLTGVRYDEAEPGYRHIVIRPVPVAKDYTASYSYKTPYGKVVSSVSNTAKACKVTVTVPVGSHATVILPLSGETREVGQGTYTFTEKK